MKKDFLAMSDLNYDELIDLLNLASQLKYEEKNNCSRKILSGQTLGMIFKKSSTRTRISFEVGMFQLGGHALYLNDKATQLGRGEPVEDTARVMSRYVNGIMIRTYEHEEVEKFAKYAEVPVINALTDYAHPCQVLADLLTIREYKGDLSKLKICYIGDGNNMANSLLVGGLIAGMQVAIATPEKYRPHENALKFAQDYKSKFTLTDDIKEAADGADVLFTDVWASMGMEDEAEMRKKEFRHYQINDNLMKCAKPDAMVLHCLPAHRGEEITAEVFEAHANEIFEEAENRLHAQKAVMVKLMAK